MITGGTGSFGTFFTNKLLENQNFKHLKKIIIYSRDELKQTEMAQKIDKKKLDKVRFFIGDVRDRDRLNRATEDVDIVIHAAALKHVPIAENNPFEFIKTNIIGAQNVIDASLNNRVDNVIALSTDKAVSPINLYGATKLASDKLFTSANLMKGSKNIKFSVVRYGNVFSSRGSVVPLFLKLIEQKKILSITHKNMTRFNITLEEACNFVFWSICNNIGGEVFVPKLPSYRILDLAKAINPKSKIQITGVRPGEKIYEELISKADSLNTYDLGYCYSLLDSIHDKTTKIYNKKKYKKVKDSFEYNSLNNKHFLSVNQIQKLIKNHIK
tara:strand:- start:53 stop:1033 length:981 start_codon:yes stop_codon:yes gene_type:complete